MKPALITIAKWVWFGLLMLVALGYMASGLSKPSEPADPTVVAAQQTKLGATAIDDAQSTDSLSQVILAVNQARREQLLHSGLASAEPADWLTICRRMSLALVGSGISLEEIRQLETLPESEREATHLDRLLNDPRYHDYWAERWARYIVGADEGPFIVYRRRRFRHWLSDQLASDQRYDNIVSDLITAEGLWTDRPEVNFLTVTFDSNDGNPDPIRLAARTSRAFLGLRIDCLQCHSDFLGNVSLGDPNDPREGLQSDFHQLAAFYSAAKTSGLQGVQTGQADYQYQYLDTDQEVAVTPAVPYSPELLPETGDDRSRLAAWVTHRDNQQFSRAAVSRFWALLFGQSATESVDNLPLDEPLPAMLDPIVNDFQTHRNIRRVIQIITQTDAFRAASTATFEITAQHESQHAVFPLTRLRAEQVAGSIAQASRIKSIDRQSSLLVQLIRFGSINDFLKRYGDLGENEFSNDGVTIPQRLLLLNGKMLREAGGSNPVLNTASHINMFAADDRQAVDTVFLCVLNRYPHAHERDYFAQRLANCDQRSETIEDFFWTLANSTEFAWNH
ncbi:DUF1549 and DUF1553 domain-containing protein [Stieleria sp. TO1_6]|uniref:DUF1549 domain-containing protein n=1 Tax=Stieleria tagensis TaxID=2956795 RepID=UPI00209B53A6|nr:DUF1549 domain-containing protein [Stieleria tagensis]MCO8124041.1 DUF1549 and DUF1553 domain-containing protein [Stieleria tagensis]